MKILRILLIILVPAMGIVSCRKADVKPSSPNTSCSSQTTVSNTSNAAGREAIEQEEPAGQPTDIYGSGDDDRNGGEKRKKRD